ncbi:pilus assembly protein CpaB [Palleronia aestuarii]|uniref:Pilus assembly protein CpaB n=1 Tax=Palleronia aestuarii TaxID=568105 RepID=A0A2W7N444_9RHOB|nr:Flp pilus assembly protein CpaB [Palleronia aestuarii]PZX13117.1 pilus assembly protein CpaB [Palleronia aestuarii]
MPVSRLLVLALSLTAGGGAAYLTTQGEPEVRQVTMTQTVPDERVEILVAGADLEQRRLLAPGDLEWRSWPKDAVLDGYVTRAEQPGAAEELAGNLLRASIAKGEPVRRDRIGVSDGGYLSAMLSSGKRAVSVKVTAESTAGGFILPEDRVDVLHTVVENNGAGGVTRTVVTNVRVLAVDQQVTAPETNAVSGAKTATLELGPGQAEIVSGAEATGILSLSLRSSADNDEMQIVANEDRRTIQIFGRGQVRTAQTN